MRQNLGLDMDSRTGLGPETRMGAGYETATQSRYGYKTQNEDGPVLETGFQAGSGHEIRIVHESGLETGARTRSEPETGTESGPAEQESKPLAAK